MKNEKQEMEIPSEKPGVVSKICSCIASLLEVIKNFMVQCYKYISDKVKDLHLSKKKDSGKNNDYDISKI